MRSSIRSPLPVVPVPSSSWPLIQAQFGGKYGVKLACGIVKIQYLACAIGINCWELVRWLVGSFICGFVIMG